MITELNRLLKSGDIRAVQSQLDTLDFKKIERNLAFGLANIARRVGYHQLAFKILNPIVRPKNKFLGPPASPQEIVEYGVVLFRLGVINEARRVLSSYEANGSPESGLYLAFTYFGEWDYQKALGLIKDYTEKSEISDYDRLVGMVNLAQAYLGLDNPKEATSTIIPAIDSSRKHSYKVILANALQTLAEALIDERDFKEARRVLKEIESVIGLDHYRYNLYLKKDLAVIELQENMKSQASTLDKLRELGEVAQQKRLSELARECDFVIAQATQNENLFKRVYYGTPHRAYRERMRRNWVGNISLGPDYVWYPSADYPNASSASEKAGVFDVYTGTTITAKDSNLRRGSTGHRLLLTLSSDFYKKFKTEELFSLLFPEEHFNLVSSRHKIHDTISRTRNWLEAEGVDIIIEEHRGAYKLNTRNGLALKVPLYNRAADIQGIQILDLLKIMGDKSFTVGDVKQKLGVPVSTANRYLRLAVERKIIDRIGSGRGTKYRKSS